MSTRCWQGRGTEVVRSDVSYTFAEELAAVWNEGARCNDEHTVYSAVFLKARGWCVVAVPHD